MQSLDTGRGSLSIASRRILLADRETAGTVRVEDGIIVAIDEERIDARAVDIGGDLLIPGLVELHTDHLESHLKPRPAVHWHAASAIQAYDAQIAASGITTVFDSMRVGGGPEEELTGQVIELARLMREAEARGLLRVDHHTHLRCEVAAADVIEGLSAMLAEARVDMISLMDHTPGARQFRDVETWKRYFSGKSGRSEEDILLLIDERRALYEANHDRHRRALVALARERGIAMASHDDTTRAHVEESIADGVAIAEFPTTEAAARASHEGGLSVLMGAPNVVRGGSHSGNVSALELAQAGLLDILSSDYVPISLVMGAFDLADVPGVGGLPGAIRLVTKNPALATGLTDRGEIATGKRADLARITLVEGRPVVREVWRLGARVA